MTDRSIATTLMTSVALLLPLWALNEKVLGLIAGRTNLGYQLFQIGSGLIVLWSGFHCSGSTGNSLV